MPDVYSINRSAKAVAVVRYGADGTLLQRVSEEPLRSLAAMSAVVVTRPMSKTVDSHVGALTFRDRKLLRVDTPAGYVTEGGMHYYIRDHQGNVRQVTDADGRVEQDSHYYPYGMLTGESGDILATARKGRNPFLPSEANPYLYGGKEYLTTAAANLLDFTARAYDPATLLFLTPDPLRDRYLPVNPYLYCGADPVNRVDPTGMEWSRYTDEKGIIHIQVEVNFASLCSDLPIDKITRYQTLINDAFDRMLSEATNGSVRGKIIYSTDKTDNLIPNLFFYRRDRWSYGWFLFFYKCRSAYLR